MMEFQLNKIVEVYRYNFDQLEFYNDDFSVRFLRQKS